MSVRNFAQEFSRLVYRYTRTSSLNNDLSNPITPLTDQEIVSTTHHVLLALMRKDFDENISNLLEIINNETVKTSEILAANIKREPNIEDVSRSQDHQSVATDDDSSFSDTSRSVVKREKEIFFNSLQNEKKFISRSNPAICINKISRSDTFVREGNGNNIKDEGNIRHLTDAETNGEMNNLLNNIYQVLKEVRTSITNNVTKLNHLEQLFPESTRLSIEVTPKAQQSLLIKCHSSPHRTSIMNKTTMPDKARRSSTVPSTFPKTSPCPKSIATNRDMFERRKSTGALGTNAASAKKSSESTKIDLSVSNINLSLCNKKSPEFEFQPKFKKNPKYAHVRSTIPKAISQKKKT